MDPLWTPSQFDTQGDLVNHLIRRLSQHDVSSPLKPHHVDVLKNTPRHIYVPSDEQPPNIRNYPKPPYSDAPFKLGKTRQTISCPTVHALCLSLLTPTVLPTAPPDATTQQNTQCALDVGSGSGYFSSLLSRLHYKVTALEVLPPLHSMGKANVESDLGCPPNITHVLGNVLSFTAPSEDEAKYDVIHVGCEVQPSIVPSLLALLKSPGRMTLPLTLSGSKQQITLYLKSATGAVTSRAVGGYIRYVPMRLPKASPTSTSPQPNANRDIDWNKRYAKGYCYGKAPCSTVSRLAGILSSGVSFGSTRSCGGKVLALCGGYGRNARPFPPLGYPHVTVVDSSPAACERGRRYLPEASFVASDWREYLEAREGETWDVVVLCYAHCVDAALAWRHVRVGGHLVFEGFSEGHVGPGPPVDALAGRRDLDGMGVEVHGWEGERELVEGTFHRFGGGRKARVMEAIRRKGWDWAGERAEVIYARVRRGAAGDADDENQKLLEGEVTVLQHPLEHGRLASTARLLPIIHVGEEHWRSKADALMEGGAYVLYPGGEVSPEEFMALSPRPHLVVPDGTQAQAGKVFEWLNPPKDRVVSIPSSRYTGETSALLESLHPGSGTGRLSTAEAVAMVLGGRGLEEAVQALVAKVKEADETARRAAAVLPSPPSPPRPAARPTSPQTPKRAGAVPPLPPGLRRCNVCNVTLSSWKRRDDHFLGSRHAAECERLGLGGEKGWDVVRGGRVEAVDRVWEEMEVEEGRGVNAAPHSPN